MGNRHGEVAIDAPDKAWKTCYVWRVLAGQVATYLGAYLPTPGNHNVLGQIGASSHPRQGSQVARQGHQAYSTQPAQGQLELS